MNEFLIAITLIFFLNVSLKAQTENKNYDESLAKSLNADDYGMKKYVLVMLKPGSNTDTSKSVTDSVFTGHMNNINRLDESGELVVAGPIMKSKEYRGIFIFNVETIEEAKALIETDPAVSAKFLEPEMFLWYGTAALMETTKIHRKIEKYSF